MDANIRARVRRQSRAKKPDTGGDGHHHEGQAGIAGSTVVVPSHPSQPHHQHNALQGHGRHDDDPIHRALRPTTFTGVLLSGRRDPLRVHRQGKARQARLQGLQVRILGLLAELAGVCLLVPGAPGRHLQPTHPQGRSRREGRVRYPRVASPAQGISPGRHGKERDAT